MNRQGFPVPIRGRGAASNPDSRYAELVRERFDDGWASDEPVEEAPRTELIIDHARSVITRNDSPDVPFSQSINPYRGCEHGCAYCFARPSHAYLGLSPGLDFETKIAWKPDAPECLLRELGRRAYVCSPIAPIALGINTDAYQPVERRLRLTRRLLEILAETRHPVSIVTKSALIERDRDVLADMARDGLVQVMFSVTTLDGALAHSLEPRAARPQRRLEALRSLSDAGIPCGVLCAPLIPAVNDHELEAVFAAAAEAGARSAGYVLLRLPREVRPLFRAWLEAWYPDRAEHVYSLMRQAHGGREYDARFGERMRGQGAYADMLAQRARLARRRFRLDQDLPPLNCSRFRPPSVSGQGELF